MDDRNERVSEFEEWDELIHSNFQRGMLDSVSTATIETTSVLDKFSMWLLVGTGATASLIIVNADKIIPHVAAEGLKTGIILLALSSIFGFCSKIFAVMAESSVKVAERATQLLKELQEQYEQQCEKRDELAEDVGYVSKFSPDLEVFIEDYINLFPFKLLRWHIRRILANSNVKTKGGNKIAVHYVVYQSLTLSIQSLLYVVFLMVVAFSFTL